MEDLRAGAGPVFTDDSGRRATVVTALLRGVGAVVALWLVAVVVSGALQVTLPGFDHPFALPGLERSPRPAPGVTRDAGRALPTADPGPDSLGAPGSATEAQPVSLPEADTRAARPAPAGPGTTSASPSAAAPRPQAAPSAGPSARTTARTSARTSARPTPSSAPSPSAQPAASPTTKPQPATTRSPNPQSTARPSQAATPSSSRRSARPTPAGKA